MHSTFFATLENIDSILFDLMPGDRIFLRGELGAGKTTLTQKLIQRYLKDTIMVSSPTYTYYQKYGDNVYHFDLYRAQDEYDLMRIGADEILDDPDTICIIEWPERLWSACMPTKIIDITLCEGGRSYTCENCQVSKIDNT
jgi:tRNA threonylcarbamoyladenosine biosynthesis protein TsaE